MVVFIDEAGTLPDTADKFIVVVALGTNQPEKLKRILPKFRRKTPLKGKRRKERSAKEFKFHYVGDITRRKVLEELNSKNIKIYALVIDKMNRKVADNYQNYGKLIKELVERFSDKEDIKEIYIDKHFGDKTTTSKLQNFLEESIPGNLKFIQVDSLQDPRIDLADFVAGAIFRKYRASDPSFYKIILNKIGNEEVKKWNQL